MICCVVFSTPIFLPLIPASGANAAQDARRLELARPVERMIGGGETHRYRIAPGPDLCLRIAVMQRGVDVIITVLDPAGHKVRRIDRPNSAYGPESVSVIAEEEGDYLIEVRTTSKYAAPGDYVITATEMRKATEADRLRAAAENAVSAAEELRAGVTADTLSQAVEKFGRAATIWRSLGERYEEAIAVYGRGWCYQRLGDYFNAICDFRKAATQMEELQDRAGETMARSALAWDYISVGKNEQAQETFRQALRTYESMGNLRGQAIALYGIGLTHALKSEPEQALEYLERSLELRVRAGDRSGEVLTLSAIGMTYNDIGRPEKAIDYSRRALELSQTLGGLQIRANPLSKLGWAHLTLRKLAESRDYFEQALRISQSTGDRASEIPIRYGLARVEMEQGRLDEARRHIEASLEITESLRGRNSNLEVRSTYLAQAQDHYQLYAELLMRLHRGDPAAGHASAALQASERGRARTLLDALAEAQIDLRGGVDAQLIAEERRLQIKLNDLSAAQMRLLSREHTVEQASAIETNIKETVGLLEETLASIKKANPRYVALTQPQPVSVEYIQRELLDDDTLLLEYALGEERSYLFLVSSSSLQAFTLPPRAEIEARARRVYSLLSARALYSRAETPEQREARIAEADAELPREAAELSRLILSPAATQLGEKRLLIVAQGALQLIPFAALPAPGTEGQRDRETERRRDGEAKLPPRLSIPPSLRPSVSQSLSRPVTSSPLIVNHEIVNLPSASTLAVLRRETAGRQPAPKTIALLADPIFENTDERLKLAAHQRPDASQPYNQSGGPTDQPDSERRDDLLRAIESFGESNDEFIFPRLTASGWEAEQIARLAPADQVFKALSFDANRQMATSGKLSDYRIVHFASHSFINTAHSNLSGIVLSLIDRNGQEQDGFLRLHEIYNLRLQADLVVLGGCRTGLGKEIKGEGVMSLTRGFMYAGAPRVIVSAWEAQDRPSATLMVKFYRGLLGPKKLSAAAALRSAQIEMLRDKQFAAPYFWAGFTLQGEWR
ncbi:MAG TPA: CHAT domain-containing tetratricopeptide repeat protein [Blastocatellia bacterium]|jgi:CHAT domain-containing protein/Tfp pilus assembly protein PilF|nr:CHAT domain-containing tetratricopeptide repeat protein [Blastocatellia bacterium]